MTSSPRKRDLVVQLSTRISVESRDLIDDVVDREGLSIRDIVEQAVKAKWGTAA